MQLRYIFMNMGTLNIDTYGFHIFLTCLFYYHISTDK